MITIIHIQNIKRRNPYARLARARLAGRILDHQGRTKDKRRNRQTRKSWRNDVEF